jgi:hypothetical protein
MVSVSIETGGDFLIKNGYFETFVWAWIALGLITFFYLFI